MSLAFWNNPIVVSAFRVKARRATPLRSAALYVLLLAVGSALLRYYQARLGIDWPRTYFLCLMGIQFAVSVLIPVTATGTSLRSEVVTRTLDFQRLTALTPRQVLLGKLLGEAAPAFFLGMATVPLSVLCWLWGGVRFDVMVMLYVNIFTTILLFGSLGMLQRLDTPGDRPGGTGVSGGQLLVVTYVVLLVTLGPPVVGLGGSLLSVPWAAAPVGLLTPLPSFYGVAVGKPWDFGLSFFDVEIPFLVVTPVAQAVLAWLAFRSMVRQLINPLNPPLSKATSYVTLLVLDMIAAGVLFDSGPRAIPVAGRCTAFCAFHLLAGLWLMSAMTPWRETLHSWVWRFRGRGRPLRNAWLGERTENGLAVLTFAGIGAAALLLLVWLPALSQGPVRDPRAFRVALSALAVAALLTLAFGAVFQFMALLAGRTGLALTMMVVLFPVAIPHIVGEYYELDWLLALTPTAHFARWFSESDAPLALVPLLLAYGLLFLGARYLLRRHLYYLENTVDRKLGQMGVLQTGGR